MADNQSSSSGGRPIQFPSIARRNESPPCSPRAHSIHQTSAASSFSSAPLPIRGPQMADAPPPLAPPRNVPTGNMLMGRAPPETWTSRQAPKGTGSFQPGSSLFGNWSHPPPHHPKRSLHKSSLSGSDGNLPPSPLGGVMNRQGEMKQEEGLPS